MKKTILFVLILGVFTLIIPGTALFADGFGGRLDVGLNLFTFPTPASPADDAFSLIPVLPLVDMGLYGQVNYGIIKLGVGIRGVSLILINVFWPSLYAELNIQRFTVNAQIGGGALFLFPIFLLAGPYFVPELSVWYTVSKSNSENQMRIGIGALSLLSPQIVNENFFRDFSNNVVIYLAFKAVYSTSR